LAVQANRPVLEIDRFHQKSLKVAVLWKKIELLMKSIVHVRVGGIAGIVEARGMAEGAWETMVWTRGGGERREGGTRGVTVFVVLMEANVTRRVRECR
jgi:hypothetical protein